MDWHNIPPYWKDYTILINRFSGPILDVGCGNAWLAKYVQNYTGMDISPSGVERAKKEGYNVLLASAEEPFPFEDNSFGCVFMKDVLEHLQKPMDAVSEVMRVLKEDGHVIAFAPDAQRWVWDDYTHVRPYSKKSFYQLFVDYGANVKILSYEPIMPGVGKFCNLLRLTRRPFFFWWLAKLPFMRRNVYIIAKKV